MSLSHEDDPRNTVLRWADDFSTLGIYLFPVLIEQRDGKWDKRPLVKDWVNEATLDWRSLNWNGANGVGLRMGANPDGTGWYALDVDAHKPGAAVSARQWITAHDVPRTTRQHRTVSGGWHLLYKLPPAWLTLRTRANIVPGLDSRGQGGFIAYGRGYSVVMDEPPVELPAPVCAVLDMAPASGPLDFGDVTDVDQEDTCRRMVVVCQNNPRFLHRFQGGALGLTDKSRSALDMSLARLMAQVGFKESEITFVLMEVFKYGQAAQLQDWRGERAARRCAARAMQDLAMETGAPKTDTDSAEIAEEMSKLTGGSIR